MRYYFPFSVYVDPSIVIFTSNPPIAEMGSTVPSVILNWTLAKTVKTVQINSTNVPPFSNALVVTGPFTVGQSWRLSVTDEQEKLSATTQLQFLNKAYFGFVTTAPLNSANILALENSQFAPSLKLNHLVAASAGKVFCYAYPARFGAPRKVIAVESTNKWSSPPTVSVPFTDYTSSTVSFTNASGFTENYTVITFNGTVPSPKGTVMQFS